MRKVGIHNYNTQQMKEVNPVYERERKGTLDEDLVLCLGCKAMLSKLWISHHKQDCIVDLTSMPKSLPVSILTDISIDTMTGFEVDVLSKFINDPIGRLCRADQSIRIFGAKHYEKVFTKKDKEVEVKKSVMSEMRRLSNLYLQFRTICESVGKATCDSRDMLNGGNFDELRKAVCIYTSHENDEIKAGLKQGLFYLIKSFAKIIKGTYLTNKDDESALEVEKFVEVYELHKSLIFGDATYIINKNKNRNSRLPNVLPLESDVTLLKEYIITRIKVLMKNTYEFLSISAYTELRDLAVSRLTLFNARRGGEPARLTIMEWQEGEQNLWLNTD